MTERASVMAIDGSMNVGVVIGAPGQDPGITSWSLPNNGEELGETFLVLRQHLWKAIVDSRAFGQVPIRTIVFESPIVNRRQLNLRMLRKLYGISGIVEMLAYEFGIDCLEIAAGTWKKAFVGAGDVSKKERPYRPWVRCEQLGWRVRNNDEADACGIWATFIASLNDPLAVHLAGPLFKDL